MSGFHFEEWYEQHHTHIENLLINHFESLNMANMGTACQYPLRTGGKRFRPMLVYAALAACTSDLRYQTLRPYADACALAVELIHTYSLVHDDLPCMDNDDTRRGHPTVHRIYSEDVAVLVGDALLTEAFGALCELPTDLLKKALRWTTHYAGINGMLGGQSIDIGFEGGFPYIDPEEPLETQSERRDQTINTLYALHKHKTGALIELAVVLGGHIAGLQGIDLIPLQNFGQAVGLGFQLADDILDAEEDAAPEGPPSFVKMLGIDATRKLAEEQWQLALKSIDSFKNPAALRSLAAFAVKRSH